MTIQQQIIREMKKKYGTKLPTAKEVLSQWDSTTQFGTELVAQGAAIKAMKEFAAIHVKAALKEVEDHGQNMFGDKVYTKEYSFSDAYPLENIK